MQQQPLAKRQAFDNFLSQQSSQIAVSQHPQVSRYSAINNNNLIPSNTFLMPNNHETGIKEPIDTNVLNNFNNNKTALTLQQQQQIHLMAIRQQQSQLLQKKIIKSEINQSQALTFSQIQQQAQQHAQRLQAFREAQFLQQRQLQQVCCYRIFDKKKLFLRVS